MTVSKLTVLIASYLEPELVDQIRREVPQVEVIYRPDLLGVPRYIADHNGPISRTEEQEAEWQSLLAQADIFFDFDHTHVKDLPKLAPKLKWIQATSAGIGQFVKQNGYDQTGWIMTTASGVHARPLAEFVIQSMLFFARDFEYLQREKAVHHWARNCTTELAGKTLAIIGLGKIGREAARLAKAFDVRVIGNRRNLDDATMPNVDELYPPDELTPLLTQANYLLLSTPHTPETEGMIGAEQIAQLPKGAVIINIARGAVMDYAAMTEALQNGHLRGASLDVFATEPLPADDPLWDMSNVIISPHSASTADTENAKITRLFCDNLKRYLAGEPLQNVLDTQRYY
ncbi:MAG: D-2-hydroxyacid dehydrogenase [Anaerolineaceae bacterium]|nr:D-2-hydroxyacid dehydrogenase [Anaerolineaceae bacterium]